ncbi:hypothetical protein AVT69_gp002 [Pseudomonas phage PhiPA3]|uniref:Uncharacterized protein 002 n=1 Tax=Pseudomonas phage PhiPA3 TaxID=998086 RepID=F8SJN3_BPPA3|nr:hypothetical protein AVT69_gp002 [Pseudomonas phage PhiPA3]AEH03428.1 hypothetical protein [Pseudomonas phage PhiPA3]
MTDVAYPYLETSTLFDNIVKGQILEPDAESPQLSHVLKITDAAGIGHEVTFFQLSILLAILQGNKHELTDNQPHQYLVNQWVLTDLHNIYDEGYVMTSHRVIVDHVEEVATFTGTLVHQKTIRSHPNWQEGFTAPVKEFEFNLENFGIFHQIVFSQCIANLTPELDWVARTFGHSYIFEMEGRNVRVASIQEEGTTE